MILGELTAIILCKRAESRMTDPASALNVNIRKFDMKMIPQDAVCVFIGRRRTGKSTLVRDLLFHHQSMPLGTVISGTARQLPDKGSDRNPVSPVKWP